MVKEWVWRDTFREMTILVKGKQTSLCAKTNEHTVFTIFMSSHASIR